MLAGNARVFIRHPVRPSGAQTRRHFNSRRRAEPRRWCRGERSDIQRRLRDACPSAALCRRGSPGDASFDESLARCVVDDGCAGEPARLASPGEIFRGNRGLSMAKCRSDRRRSQRAAARAPHHAGVLQSSRRTVDGRNVRCRGDSTNPSGADPRSLSAAAFGSAASDRTQVFSVRLWTSTSSI